jgi:carboxyl-terminal processing protease
MPKLTYSILRKTIIATIAASLIFSGGYYLGRNELVVGSVNGYPNVTINRETPPHLEDLDFALFWKVWDTLDAKYYDKDKLVHSNMVYGAIRGMVAAVEDPYTVFLPPAENKVVQEDLQGNFEGVGIQIGFRGNQLAVIAPLPGSPAERQGIRAGDYIVGIKDENKDIERGTVGITLPEAVQAIRGQRGTKISLTLLRDGVDEPIVVDIIRESINVPSIVVEYVGDGRVAHLKVLKFGGETLGEWNKAVTDILLSREVTGIIVDVRNNPGGYLQGAVDLATDFLDLGTVVVVEEMGSGYREEFKTKSSPRLSSYDTVVLINGGSASASEIFAGALRDKRNIKLVGEYTFGKGTIQEPQQLNGGSGLHITIARWLTPAGFWVNDGGLKPDVEIENDQETEEDEQLIEAVKLLTG